MTDQPVPLSRFRAALARPSGRKRVDALLAADDPATQVQALSVPDLYFLVKDVGLADCYELVHLASAEQIQGLVDLDVWDRDRPQLEGLKPWLGAILAGGFEEVERVWLGLDDELCALMLARWCRIYDHSLGEAPDDEVDGPLYSTPDSFFTVEVLSEREDDIALVFSLLEDLYRADLDLARHTLMAARSATLAELEEYAYRWRSGRMADLGYVDFYDALEVFRPLDPESVSIGEDSADRLPKSDDAAATALPVRVLENLVGRPFLARALDRLPGEDAERVEPALLVLVNQVLSAARVSPGDEEVIAVGTEHATATLALGLEVVSGGDLDRAAAALGSVALSRLHRVGYTVTLRLSRLARALAPRAVAAGELTQAVLAAVLRSRPFYARELDQPPADGVRPFESTLDLQRVATHLAALTFRIAIAEALGIDVVAVGEMPEPRAELDDYLRTALARSVLAQPLSPAALSSSDIAALRASMEGGRLPEAARARAAEALAELLDGAAVQAGREHLPRLVGRWMDEIGELLGGLPASAPIDPRFLSGLVVSAGKA